MISGNVSFLTLELDTPCLEGRKATEREREKEKKEKEKERKKGEEGEEVRTYEPNACVTLSAMC